MSARFTVDLDHFSIFDSQQILWGNPESYLTILWMRYPRGTIPSLFFSIHTLPLLIDEVQYVPELFRHIKMLIDKNRKPGSFFLTGSQPYALTQKAAESLAGRIGIFELYPLSAREIRGDPLTDPRGISLTLFWGLKNKKLSVLESSIGWQG